MGEDPDWCDEDISLLIEIWEEYFPRMKTFGRYGSTFKRMAMQLNEQSTKFRTGRDIQLKLEKLKRQYSSNKVKMDMGRKPPWRFFHRIHAFMVNAPPKRPKKKHIDSEPEDITSDQEDSSAKENKLIEQIKAANQPLLEQDLNDLSDFEMLDEDDEMFLRTQEDPASIMDEDADFEGLSTMFHARERPRPQASKKSSRKANSDTAISTALEELSKFKQIFLNGHPEIKTHDQFGLTVAEELREFRNPLYVSLAKVKILQVIHRIRKIAISSKSPKNKHKKTKSEHSNDTNRERHNKALKSDTTGDSKREIVTPSLSPTIVDCDNNETTIVSFDPQDEICIASSDDDASFDKPKITSVASVKTPKRIIVSTASNNTTNNVVSELPSNAVKLRTITGSGLKPKIVLTDLGGKVLRTTGNTITTTASHTVISTSGSRHKNGKTGS